MLERAGLLCVDNGSFGLLPTWHIPWFNLGMETTRIRNLHTQYARPAEASPFFKACAERTEIDSILAGVFASKAQQWGTAATILDRNFETRQENR